MAGKPGMDRDLGLAREPALLEESVGMIVFRSRERLRTEMAAMACAARHGCA